MKVLITGSNGQLGKALSLKFKDAVLTDSSQLDITKTDQYAALELHGIDAIINAAAYTKVDDAEHLENLSLVWEVNSQGPANLAWLAAKLRIPLVHISTDYVFDGNKKEGYNETDLFNPISVYGASKASGDLAVSRYNNHYIFRTSWVIGDGNNFVRIMQNLAEKGIDPNVVNDQIGRLTFCDTLAEAIYFALTNTIPFGTYNVTNSGDIVSWFDIAQQVFELSGFDHKRVSPISTEDYYSGKDHIAPRPHNSELSLDKIERHGFKPHNWRDKLKEYIK